MGVKTNPTNLYIHFVLKLIKNMNENVNKCSRTGISNTILHFSFIVNCDIDFKYINNLFVHIIHNI